MKNIADITIIGSGVIGLMTAKQLRAAGASVCIIEKNVSSLESSWAGGGILLPLYPWRQPLAITTLVMQSLKLYPRLSTELTDATTIDPEWYDCGLLMLQNPDVEDAIAWCQRNKVNYQTPETSLLENLNTEPVNPLWLPEIAQARNPRLLKSLKAFLLQQGVKFIQECCVTGIQLKQQRINTINTNKGDFAVNHLIMATGAWTGELAKKILPKYNHLSVSVNPVKGQMLLFEAQADTLPQMILDHQHYLIPRKEGKILVGSTVEESAFDKTTTKAAKDKLQDFAFNLFPALKHYPLIKHWAGLRPATAQGVPYIDNHPEIENLSINAGHFRNGLVMAPASAQLMTDLILKRPPIVNPEPYQLTRSV